MIGPATAQKLLPDIALPPTTPKPCRANTAPATSISTPTTATTNLVTSLPFVVFGKGNDRRIPAVHRPDRGYGMGGGRTATVTGQLCDGDVVHLGERAHAALAAAG